MLFPYDTGKEFATKGKVPVKVTFDGVLYMGSFIKYGNPLPQQPPDPNMTVIALGTL